MRKPTILFALIIFLLALAVRLPELDTFFTADEFLWVERSRDFLGGLLSPNYPCLLPNDTETNVVPGQGLACTLRTGHPGVVTMWTGAAGITLQWLTRPADDARTLLEFVRDLPTNPVDRRTIAPLRLPTVIISAFFVAGVYFLLLKLFQPAVALLAGILLALDPFHIALSRVLHHDALSTTFVITSALSLIIYFGVDRRRRWLLLAGALAGTAMVSKSVGLFLVPYAGLLGLWSLGRDWATGRPFRWALGRIALDGLLWAIVATIVFVALWPAMWVIPGRALLTIYTIGFKYASGGHAKGVLFFNTIAKDPGPLFYPVTWFFRTNFWQMVGVFVALVAGGLSLRRRWATTPLASLKTNIARFSPRGYDDPFGLLLGVGAVLFFFLIFMTLGEKKQDRYVLPIYPMLDIVAAGGLWWLVRARQKLVRVGLVAAVLTVNLGLAIWSLPYTFAYYNPLVGGIGIAARTITIGWGDGLDQAAAYLNAKPNAAQLKAASWYGSTFAPYFKGKTIRYSDQKGNALAGNYVIFYVNQRQRHYPDDEIWRYMNDHYALEKTVQIKGVDYAWIFTGPGIGHYVEDQKYSGMASLLGWDWAGPVSPDDGPVTAGSDMPVSLFWEYRGKQATEPFFVRLIGADGDVWAEDTTRPTAEFADSSHWRQGQIIEERGVLHIPAETPPADYTLQLGFYTRAPAVASGELTFPTANAPSHGPLQSITVRAAAPLARGSGMPLGDLQLLPVNDFTRFGIENNRLNFDLFWVLPQRTTHRYQAAFALLDDGGVTRWEWPSRPLITFLPTADWPAGISLRTRWHLPLDDPRLPGGDLRLQLQLLDETDSLVAAADLGALVLPGRRRQFTAPQPERPLAASLGQGIVLLGADGLSAVLTPGASLPLTFYWQGVAPVDENYTVFVQLLAPDGQVVAQNDAQPQDGAAPTSTWTPGEIVSDTHTLRLPANLQPGDYRLITGMYLLETGARLPVTQNGAVTDFAVVATWDQP